MKKRKVLSLLLIFCMVLGLTACASNDETTPAEPQDVTQENSGGSTEDNASEDTAIDISEHVTVKFVVVGDKPTTGDIDTVLEQVNAKLTEKVNAELDVYYIEWVDWLTQYNLLLLSGDPTIDLVVTGTDWLDAWPNIQKGAFLELSEEMLQTYAPLTWASVSEEHWDMCKYEGNIYLLPENNYKQWTNHGFIYRQDWATEFGLTNGVHSFEELGQYFAGIKQNYPDVIPWDAPASGQTLGQIVTGGYFQAETNNLLIEGLNVPIFFGTSADDPFTLVSPYMEGQEFIDYAVMMKEWGDAGYWREDVLNYAGDADAEFYAGQTGAAQKHTMTYISNIRPQMDEKQPGSDTRFFSFSEPSENLMNILITHGAGAIAAGSQHPERTLMVYDLLRNDEEIYRLMNYGIEGVNYTVTEDGKLSRPEGYNAETDAFYSFFWCGRNDDLELDDASWYSGKEDIYADYESYAIDYPYSQLVLETDSISSYMSNLSDVYTSYITAITFGKAGDPEQAVADFRADMKAAGYDEVYNEIQSQLTAYKEYLGQ